MTRLLFAAFAAVMLLCAPVAAQTATQCVPVTSLIVDLMKAEVPADRVYATKDVGIVAAYLRGLGLTVPDGSEPIGLITVDLSDRAFVALVEPGDCIRHTAIVPLNRHKTALSAAVTGV